MTRGSIRLSAGQIGWIGTLKAIYDFESTRAAGPGSYHKDINEVLWTREDLLSGMPGLRDDTENLDALLEWMEQERQVMVIRPEDGDAKYITRTAEIVRLLGHTYEYWHRGRPGMDATRWLVEEKKFPSRAIGAVEAQNRLRGLVETEIGSGTDVANLLSAIDLVVEGTARNLVGENWEDALFTEFQIQATEEMIRSQFKQGHDRRTQILTAGVGTGKTIAFTMGMMISAVEGLLGGRDSRRCHLFLYPRTALAKDQFSKISAIADMIDLENVSVHFEHADYYNSIGLSNRKGILQTYRRGFPLLIVTTLETLKRRLQQPLFVSVMSERLARVVLDEIHLISDLTGTQIVHLMRRLKAVSPDGGPLWLGSSATVACPESHAATVFGVSKEDVKVIEPDDEDMETIGLVHHVFLRPGDRISTLGCLVNATSVLTHNRRDNLGNRPENISQMCKTIGFADNLDLLGRWHEDLRENERTENDFSTDWGRRHPVGLDTSQWHERQRELPYSLRFHNPLSRIVSVPRGRGNSPYPTISLPIDADACERCRAGESLSFGTADEDEMRLLGRLVYREPSEDDDNVEEFAIRNARVFQNSTEVGTLDMCPYLRAGACFWFPRDDFDVAPIPSMTRYCDFSSVARSRIYSSKVGSLVTEDDDLSSLAFQAGVWDVYGPFYRENVNRQALVPVDVVMSSPSLEVGIDLENVTESFLFKAIRNVSSYRQKVGRAGREHGSDTMNVTMLSSRATDFHYYRQPRKLVSLKSLDPIPLKEANPQIMRSTAYMAVWDFLALRANLPESIPLRFGSNGISEFAERIRACLEYVDENSQRIANWLTALVDAQLSRTDIDGALRRTRMDLEILLVPTEGIVQGDESTCIADMVVRKLTERFRGHINPELRRYWDDIVRSSREYDFERSRIDPIELGLAEQFDVLDSLRKCGWRLPDFERSLAVLEEHEDDSLTRTRFNLMTILASLREIEAIGDPRVLFFNEQFEGAFGEDPRKAYYLSYIIEDLPVFDGLVDGLRFPRPKNLFTNPYEDEVALVEVRGDRGQRPREAGSAMLSEVMFSYVPGSWTYRPGYPMKVCVGHLEGEGRSLVATHRSLIGCGSTFSELKRYVPGPPFFGPATIDLYQPRRLMIQSSRKYIEADTARGTVLDGDEDTPAPGRRTKHVKVPRCFIEGWTHISSERGDALAVNDLGTDMMELVPDGDGSRDMIESIVHPIASSFLSESTFNPNMEVIEYVFSVSRSYTSRDVAGATLTFRNQENMTDIGFGRLIRTEGVYLGLDSDVFEGVLESLMKSLTTDSTWAPSSVQAFRAMLNRIVMEGDVHLSPFVIRDVSSLVLYSMIDDFSRASFAGLIEEFHRLASDVERLQGLARDHVVTKYREMVDDAESDGMTFPPETEEEIGTEVERMCDTFLDVHKRLQEDVPDLDGFLREWLAYTLLNTFGIAAFHALQRLCGTEDNVGYYPYLEGIRDGKYGVYLYDRDEHGNGSSETLRKFYHILYLQRAATEAEGRRLPTEDYLTILEQELLQCPQFHSDMGALELHHHHATDEPLGLPELGYVLEHSVEVEDVSREAWDSMGVRGREDAWRLPLIAAIAHLATNRYGLERDDLARAAGICWNGCPECVVSDHMMLGPLRGRDYVDKAILDFWFERGRGRTSEYKAPSTSELARGEANLDVGSPSKLCHSGEDRLLRSVSLPFMIGIELPRGNLSGSARLVIRDNDLVGMRLEEEPSGGTGRAISIGFGRLVWYDLLMTAYLDSVGVIDEDDKDVILVFYDITDIPLDFVGISERMWEAIEIHRRQSGHSGHIERLSDLLGWLSYRGFRITVCVDTRRAKTERRVSDFLRRLRGFDPTGESVSTLTKTIPSGIMHIKGLATPIGALDGSANLTLGGVERNDESVNHANRGTSDYRSVVRRLKDALHGAVEWKE